MVRTLFSIGMWALWTVFFVIYFLLVSVFFLVTFPFDRFNQIPNRLLKGLGWLILKVNPGWSYEIRGADPCKVSSPTIVVANHQSFLDLPLSYLLPWSMKWVAKRSLFRIPVFGWIINMTGHIGIDRENSKSVKKLDRLVNPINHGIPGMIFPEGTRTTDGSLRPFKNGAFVLAEQYNFQLLPVVLEGGYHAMPPGSWKMSYRQHFTISVLEPVQPADFESIGELKSHVYSVIEAELNNLRR